MAETVEVAQSAPVPAPAPTPVTVVKETPRSIEDTMAEVYEKNYPDARVARDKGNGQFKSKDAPATETAPAKEDELNAEGAETSDTATEQAQEATPAETEEKSSVEVPASWTSEAKEKWTQLSPDLQKYIADRESQAQSRLSELGRAVKATETVRPYLEPLTRLAAQRGIDPGEGLRRLLAADEALARNPAAALKWLADSYRVDLSQFGRPADQQMASESAPNGALIQEIMMLKQQLAETTNRISAREMTELQSRERSLTELVDDFAKDKDYWSDIEDDMLAQIHAIKAVSPDKDPKAILEEAHNRAVKLNETVAQKLTKAQRDKEAAAKAAADKKRAEEAKRQQSINVKSTSSATPKASSKSLEAQMEEVYDRISARG